MTTGQAIPPDVALAIDAYPAAAREKFLEIRQIVLNAAADTAGVGPITETLKWGEPAFLTAASKSGTTVRVAWKASAPDHIGVYLNCRTTLVETLRSIYPKSFRFEGNRGLLIGLGDRLPTLPLDHCMRLAQSYHRKTKPAAKSGFAAS